MNRWLFVGLSVMGCALAGAAFLLLPEAQPKLSPAGDRTSAQAPAPSFTARESAPEAIPATPVLPATVATNSPAGRPIVTPEQRNAALGVVAALGRGPTADGCQQSEAALLSLATETAIDSPLWDWTLKRMQDCLRAPTPYRTKSPLLAKLQDLFPGHPRVLELTGLQSYDEGRPADAAAELEQALGDTGTFESWQTLADAKLAVARDAASSEDRAAALASAEDAIQRALPLASDALRPYALHTMARVQLEQGNAAAAIEWANRALQAVGEGSGVYQAYMAAEMNLFAGQIYYRAGQRDTGRAYMDQGLAMASSDRQRSELRQLRDRFLELYPPG